MASEQSIASETMEPIRFDAFFYSIQVNGQGELMRQSTATDPKNKSAAGRKTRDTHEKDQHV